MTTITIPRSIVDKGDLILIPKKEFDALVVRAGEAVTERDVLRWSGEAKQLHRAGKLPKLA